ncbi:SRPBCC family protein [Robbsia sp. Bb-Pol-6]|uniref:SRPBCC family protein n=1 Tax=Robbsia betulipollinis TaxID=2981849 RepID=A0ABT3ZMM3_9BURK|nr:SRPBCC family protein [Robbsia betulipollinis]MCY0387791.1 SRPBCC family protein [Robbsia betulipollinis]
MNYEHLVQINDPLNPLIAPLSREQLWQGLVLRAEQPELFVLGLEGCTILSREGNMLRRELDYGPAKVRDRVILQPHDHVEYIIEPTAHHVGGSLRITIETPDALQLFLRFAYSTSLPAADDAAADAETARTSEIVKSAYREADIDTVRTIRELADAGKLITPSGPLH